MASALGLVQVSRCSRRAASPERHLLDAEAEWSQGVVHVQSEFVEFAKEILDSVARIDGYGSSQKRDERRTIRERLLHGFYILAEFTQLGFDVCFVFRDCFN